MSNFNISDWLPMPFWLGPPLPTTLGLYWPWAQQSSTTSTSTLNNFFNGNGRQNPCSPQNTPTATNNNAPAYENLEEIELQDIDPDLLMPRKIVVHRKYKKRVE